MPKARPASLSVKQSASGRFGTCPFMARICISVSCDSPACSLSSMPASASFVVGNTRDEKKNPALDGGIKAVELGVFCVGWVSEEDHIAGCPSHSAQMQQAAATSHGL